MASIPLKPLNALIQTMLDHTQEAKDFVSADHQQAMQFLGSGSSVTLYPPGQQPPIEFHAEKLISPYPTVYLYDEGVKALNELIVAVKKDNLIRDKVSTTAIQQAAVSLMLKCKFDDKLTDATIAQGVKDIISSLHASIVEWETFTPIDNLILHNMSELIVGNVVFRPMIAVVQEIGARLSLRMIGVTANDQAENVSVIKDVILPLFKSAYSCAIVKLESEENQRLELVHSEVDAALNLLRCYTSVLFPRDHRAFIGLRGDIVKEVPRPTVSLGTAHPYRTSITALKVGAFFEYVLTPNNLATLRQKCAFDELSAVLTKPVATRTKLEATIVTTVRWLGRGVVAQDIPEKVLSLAIALERLTMESETIEIGDKLARRLAYLLADQQEQRTAIFDRTKQLYGLRSKVVHEGKIDVPENEVYELEGLALTALIKMAIHLHEWKEISHFIKWVKSKEFV